MRAQKIKIQIIGYKLEIKYLNSAFPTEFMKK